MMEWGFVAGGSKQGSGIGFGAMGNRNDLAQEAGAQNAFEGAHEAMPKG
jgi:hypothetical protein